jgi:hypothetical protein
MKNTILFDKYEALTDTTVEEIPSIIEIDKKLIPEMFHDFKYPISSWPVIVNPELTNDLEEVCTTLPRLLKQIPKRYFQDNIQKIADFYFDGNLMPARFALMCHQKQIDVSTRLDLTLTEDGFKVLEANMGSSIGGMEFQNFEPMIRKLHPLLEHPESMNDYISKPTQSIYLKFIVQHILKYVSNTLREMNILLVGYGEENAQNTHVKTFFNDLLTKELSKAEVRANIQMGNIHGLKLVKNELTYKGAPVHAVLILSYTLNDISSDLFRAFLMNKVYFPDHPGTFLLADKRNLSLLRELALQQKFDEKHNNLILKYVPWTEIVSDKTVTYQGKEYALLPLLQEQKDRFVIKIARGLQGKDVFVGKYLSQEEWNDVIVMSLKTQDFIAQEFSDSKNILAPDQNSQWKPHKLVWGAFGFGDLYGGAWVRMAPVTQDQTGVINSATGALEALVYES